MLPEELYTACLVAATVCMVLVTSAACDWFMQRRHRHLFRPNPPDIARRLRAERRERWNTHQRPN